MKDIIKSKKYRLTKQRKIILEELRKVCTHPNAGQIHKLVSEKIPNISLATIYRNLDFLEKINLIIKLKSKNKEARYDGNNKSHYHLVCARCNKVIDIFDASIINIKSGVFKESGFQPNLDFLEIQGLCQECQ